MNQADIVSKVLDYSLMRDFLSLSFGVIFIVICNFIFAYNLTSVPNYNNINSIIWLFIFFIFAYYIGEMLKLIGRVYYFLLLSFLREKRITELKTSIKNVSDFINIKATTARGTEPGSEFEIDLFIEKHKHLKNMFERDMLNIIFIELNAGLVIAILFITNKYYLILALLVFSFLLLYEYAENRKRRMEIYALICREESR